MNAPWHELTFIFWLLKGKFSFHNWRLINPDSVHFLFHMIKVWGTIQVLDRKCQVVHFRFWSGLRICLVQVDVRAQHHQQQTEDENCLKRNLQVTVGIWNLDSSGFRMVKKRLVWKWSKFWMGSWNPNKWPLFCPKPFKIQTKTSRFWMVRFSNGWDHSYSYCYSLIPLKTGPFEIRSSKNLDFEWSNLRSPL